MPRNPTILQLSHLKLKRHRRNRRNYTRDRYGWLWYIPGPGDMMDMASANWQATKAAVKAAREMGKQAWSNTYRGRQGTRSQEAADVAAVHAAANVSRSAINKGVGKQVQMTMEYSPQVDVGELIAEERAKDPKLAKRVAQQALANAQMQQAIAPRVRTRLQYPIPIFPQPVPAQGINPATGHQMIYFQ